MAAAQNKGASRSGPHWCTLLGVSKELSTWALAMNQSKQMCPMTQLCISFRALNNDLCVQVWPTHEPGMVDKASALLLCVTCNLCPTKVLVVARSC